MYSGLGQTPKMGPFAKIVSGLKNLFSVDFYVVVNSFRGILQGFYQMETALNTSQKYHIITFIQKFSYQNFTILHLNGLSLIKVKSSFKLSFLLLTLRLLIFK